MRNRLSMDRSRVRERIKDLKRCPKTSRISSISISVTRNLKTHAIHNQYKCSHKHRILYNSSTLAMTFTHNIINKRIAAKVRLISSIIKRMRRILSLFDSLIHFYVNIYILQSIFLIHFCSFSYLINKQ